MAKTAVKPQPSPHATGTYSIIDSYLRNGGSTMDEEHYQNYKQKMLAQWFLKYYTYAEQIPAHWDENERYVATKYGQWVCKECPLSFDQFNPMTPEGQTIQSDIINHLNEHHPEFFDAPTKPRSRKRPARKPEKGESVEALDY